MQKFKEEFWKETSRLMDAHRKDGDERAAQGVVDCRILFTRLVKNLTLHGVTQRSEQLIDFLIHLNNKGLINNHDLDYEKEAKKYIKKIN